MRYAQGRKEVCRNNLLCMGVKFEKLFRQTTWAYDHTSTCVLKLCTLDTRPSSFSREYIEKKSWLGLGDEAKDGTHGDLSHFMTFRPSIPHTL